MEDWFTQEELAERLSEEMEQDARRYPVTFGSGVESV